MKLEDKIIAILGEHLGCDPENIEKSQNLVDDLGADSLDKVELIFLFEDEFKISEISDETFEEWKTVQDVIDGITNLSLDDKAE